MSDRASCTSSLRSMTPVQHLTTPLQVSAAGLQARVPQPGVFQSGLPPQQKLFDIRCTQVRLTVAIWSVARSVNHPTLRDLRRIRNVSVAQQNRTPQDSIHATEPPFGLLRIRGLGVRVPPSAPTTAPRQSSRSQAERANRGNFVVHPFRMSLLEVASTSSRMLA